MPVLKRAAAEEYETIVPGQCTAQYTMATGFVDFNLSLGKGDVVFLLIWGSYSRQTVISGPGESYFAADGSLHWQNRGEITALGLYPRLFTFSGSPAISGAVHVTHTPLSAGIFVLAQAYSGVGEIQVLPLVHQSVSAATPLAIAPAPTSFLATTIPGSVGVAGFLFNGGTNQNDPLPQNARCSGSNGTNTFAFQDRTFPDPGEYQITLNHTARSGVSQVRFTAVLEPRRVELPEPPPEPEPEDRLKRLATGMFLFKGLPIEIPRRR